MDNKKLIEVVERYYKNMSPFIREGEVGDALKEILRILKVLDEVEMPKEKDLDRYSMPLSAIDTIFRFKDVGFNLALQECRPYIASLTLRAEKAEQALGEIRGRATVEKIQQFIQNHIQKTPLEKLLHGKGCLVLAQAISKMLKG